MINNYIPFIRVQYKGRDSRNEGIPEKKQAKALLTKRIKKEGDIYTIKFRKVNDKYFIAF